MKPRFTADVPLPPLYQGKMDDDVHSHRRHGASQEGSVTVVVEEGLPSFFTLSSTDSAVSACSFSVVV